MTFADIINTHWDSAWWLWFWTALFIAMRGSTRVFTFRKGLLD